METKRIINFEEEEDKITFLLDDTIFVFRHICSDKFTMGATDFRHDVYPPHEVRLAEDYWVLETLVTQKMWYLLMKTTVDQLQLKSTFDQIYGKGDDFPIYYISWDEAKKFGIDLSLLLSKYGFVADLPTEAQWEYACRAGSYMPYSFGDKLNGDNANCDGRHPYGCNIKGVYLEQSCQVKEYAPNAFGLYDMHGNVWEWCNDWYASDYYTKAPVDNPSGPDTGTRRVIRGGGWRSFAECCRSAFRDSDPPSYRGRTLGFRIILMKRNEN